MITRVLAVLVVGSVLAAPVEADDWSGFRKCRPVGTWFINVSFPGTPLQFNELISMHLGGTLSETNQILHANSFPDPDAIPEPPPAPPPLNGSDGFGTWKRLPGCRIQWSFLKLTFNGPNPIAGTPAGYLRVRGISRIRGDHYQTVPGTTSTDLLVGLDPKNPGAVIPFGESVGVGYRLYATD